MANPDFDINLLIGGEAGQGMQTLGLLTARTLLKAGYYVSTLQSYMSRIRGGHNYFQIRVASFPVRSMTRGVDVLLAFDQNTLAEHAHELHDRSLAFYNSEKITFETSGRKGKYLGLPVSKLFPPAAEHEIYANTFFLGVLTALLNCPEAMAEDRVFETLEKKGDQVRADNQAALRAGREALAGLAFPRGDWQNVSPRAGAPSPCLHGNEAIALGAMAAGCKFYTAYPMTPSSSILDTMAHFMVPARTVVEQAEDEIAALNMVLGASFAGVRAMTGTSGGGFALMVEALSLSGMLEVPAVIALSQRPGPATGLPTRTEQGDLEFAVYAGHGEFPRVVLAPGDHEECFYLTAQAFNLAEQYQVPVLVLTDQYLADWYANAAPLELKKVKIERYLLDRADAAYQRYALTADGISPRAIPGRGPGLVVVDSDEHTADGHLTEDLTVRQQMAEKRLKKFEGLRREFVDPVVEGTARQNLVVGWGSTRGVIQDVVARLQAQGKAVSGMHFKQVWPMPGEKIKKLLSQYANIIVVENNATGQFAHLLKAETGVDVNHKVLKFDGRPFLFEELLEAVEKHLR